LKSMRNVVIILLISILFAGAISMCNRVSVSAANPVISVTPSNTSVIVGQDFTVNVTLDFAANLYGFQFKLGFDNTKLAATAIDYLGYLSEPTLEFGKVIDNTTGYVGYARTSVNPAPATTGGSPPPLAKIHFKALALGNSALHLYTTVLTDNIGNGQLIPHTTSDGQVTIMSTTQPVGGIWEPINILALVAPWIGLLVAIAGSAAFLGLFRRRLDKEINN